VLSIPHAANTTKPAGMISFVAAAIAAILCNKLATVFKVRAIGEFSLPISLLFGMAAAIVYTYLIG
jgi:hypothetical protein